MNRNEIYAKWLQLQNYIIITIVSLVALFFIPMLGSSVGLAWNIPNTTVGWIVYVSTKLLVAALNLIIFHCFILQAKVNSKDHPNYLAALEILRRVEDKKELAPRSPRQYFSGVYGKKGTTVFITTALAAVGLTQAVLTFDWVSMLTYLFTILMGVIFGVLQMNQTEIYWQEEYLRYAKEVERESLALATQKLAEPQNDTADAVGGSDVLVAPDSVRDNGTL